jgi:hypothetical protein
LHPAYLKWIKQAGSVFQLRIAVHAMPHATVAERVLVEERLVEQYSPSCNQTAPPRRGEVLVGAGSSSASNYSLFTVSSVIQAEPYVSSLSRTRHDPHSLPFPAERRAPRDQ